MGRGSRPIGGTGESILAEIVGNGFHYIACVSGVDNKTGKELRRYKLVGNQIDGTEYAKTIAKIEDVTLKNLDLYALHSNLDRRFQISPKGKKRILLDRIEL